ncbi:MAG: carbohydrate-binding protein [Caldilinea sp.]
MIELCYASSVISRRQRAPLQRLTFVALVENQAYDKRVEVRWRGEDGEWRTLTASYVAPAGGNREIWRAEVEIALADDRPLPGNVQFVLCAIQHGREQWENNGGRNYTIEADAGILIGAGHPVAHLDFTPRLEPEQRIVPITVAVSGRATQVTVEWSTDGWKTTQRTRCTLSRRHWDQLELSNARNPNQYAVGVWTTRLRIREAFRVEYAIVAEVDGRQQWDNCGGLNYIARRDNFKVLILNLHCYQEKNQLAKLATIAQVIQELNVDAVCLQEVAEHWNAGAGDWASNTARIIHEQLPQPFYLSTDWSHRGFERYREGVAILSRYPFVRTEARYVSASQDAYDIHSRKVIMGQINAPGIGVVNLFSAHLSWWDDGFRAQFDVLRAWADRRHTRSVAATLLCGDFNVKVGSEGYAHVVAKSDFEDQFLKVTDRDAFDAIFRKHGDGWQSRVANDGRIDFIFMKRGGKLRPVAAQRLFTGNHYQRVSDHEGFLVAFEPT